MTSTSTAYTLTLARPCAVHGVPAGKPCWLTPRGVCGHRAAGVTVPRATPTTTKRPNPRRTP